MKMKHTSTLLFVFILAILVLSGCSSADGGEQQETTETVSTDTSSTDATTKDEATTNVNTERGYHQDSVSMESREFR